MRISDQEAREKYESGLSSYDIASETGYSINGVLQKVRRAGGTVRQTGRNKKAVGWHVGEGGYIFDSVDPSWVFFEQMARVPKNRNHGRVLRHRRVMAEHLGRPLLDFETVHHKDGNKSHNDISNLQLRLGRHGKGVAFRCRCCGSNDIEVVDL